MALVLSRRNQPAIEQYRVSSRRLVVSDSINGALLLTLFNMTTNDRERCQAVSSHVEHNFRVLQDLQPKFVFH